MVASHTPTAHAPFAVATNAAIGVVATPDVGVGGAVLTGTKLVTYGW